MKPIRIFFLFCITLSGIVSPCLLPAQCTSFTTKTATYDTTVRGMGNDNFSFNMPLFNPSAGTLISVVIKTNVSVGYSFQAENTSNTSRSINIGVGRYDYLSGAALSNSNFAGNIQSTYGPYNLAASDGVSNSGSDYIANGPFSFLNHAIVLNDSITSSTANFLGSGTVHFDYFPSTYSSIPQNLTYNFSATDTVQFSVTYYYCNTSTLPTGIIDFSAVKESNAAIKLSWLTENESAGRTYEIEKSSNGKDFDSLAFISSEITADKNARYDYFYEIKNEDREKLFFRLKEINEDGTISYSEIRTVALNMETTNGIFLFPNPVSNSFNVHFAVQGNWQIDIFSADGVLQQRDFTANNNSANIFFRKRLAAGVYFLKATNLANQEISATSFVIE
ncbi:MAG: T9SS type A sorting domain-containing protein [Bacteroidetes bacterium]|nr:T9SS type A sorting domain-containing protein [Bacteroidota bacterium]